MSKWILVLVCLLGSLEAASLYTSQDRTHMAASIKECLSEAQESILILTFSLSDPDIIQLINQKAVEGVAVTVVIDKAHLGEILKDKAPSLEIVSRHSGEGHLHHKILIVDQRKRKVLKPASRMAFNRWARVVMFNNSTIFIL